MALSRRQFLKTAALGAAAVSTASMSPIMQALASPALPTALRTSNVTADLMFRMLNRVTFAPTPALLKAVQKSGFSAWLEVQMNPNEVADADCKARLTDYPTLDQSPPALAAQYPDRQSRPIAEALENATIMREIYSEAQLHEVMVNFWLEHFSIYHRKGNVELLNTIHDRDVIRRYAFGNFRDLLGATAKSAAMLVYLDNASSRKANPNENYAREVMELHTLGIGNYTETDVRAVARGLTGWSFVNNQDKPNYGSFQFVGRFHDTDAKTIFGMDFPAGGGIEEGERILDTLATSPATAKRIAFKLCRRFISDDPPESIVNTATDAFLKNDGEIKPVLRAILTSTEFQNAPPKFKRPLEYFIGLCRHLRLELPSPLPVAVVNFLLRMNHLPFNWVAPNGYSDEGRHWVGNMMERWLTAYRVALARPDGVQLDLVRTASADGAPNTLEGVLMYWQNALIGQPMSEADATTVLNFFRRNGVDTLNNAAGQIALAEAVALILSSPAYQYR